MSTISRLTGLAFAILLPVSVLRAAPVYPATSGTVTYLNDFFNTLSDSFNFTGPLVSVSGAGATLLGVDSNLEPLNTPFPIGFLIVVDGDDNLENGSAIANGTVYPSVQYDAGSSSAMVTALTDVTLTSGNLTVSVPAEITGTLGICSTANICENGGGIPTRPFDVSFNSPGTLTLTFEQFNFGSTYTLTHASFSIAEASLPEPGSLVYVVIGLTTVCAAVVRRRIRSAK